MSKILIIDAHNYHDVSDALLQGVKDVLDTAKEVTYDYITVPGALEIPAAVIMGAETATATYDGFIALGCVIRGETTHYDYVCEQSARGLMDLSLSGLVVINGILTVENKAQAMARAEPSQKNKGAYCAKACLYMIALRDRFGVSYTFQNVLGAET